jgi:hypothetical protein
MRGIGIVIDAVEKRSVDGDDHGGDGGGDGFHLLLSTLLAAMLIRLDLDMSCPDSDV